MLQQKEASTHKIAKTHVCNVFVTWDLAHRPKNKWVYRTHHGTFLCQVRWS